MISQIGNHHHNFYKIDPSKNSYLNQLSKLQTMSAIAVILFAIVEMALFMAIVRLDKEPSDHTDQLISLL
ncbi:hypothetical protein [Nostoc sp.]|uniref:hypothetical protein n=1 Tax=Nostoc sp. TaxID=1180 RepID=UPI002FF4E892